MPIRMSTFPAAARLSTSRISALGRNRLTTSITNGNSAMRAAKLRWCCSARIVVGTSTATCLPASTAGRPPRIGDLGLAVADVAADQAVHRLALGHVVLDDFDRRELVGRFLIGKGRFEFGYPVRVFGRDKQSPGRAARWAWMSISS